jgi:hypothetical protein
LRGKVAHLTLFVGRGVERVTDPVADAGALLHYRGGEKTIENGAPAIPEKARRFLQAAAVEAFGRPGAYVIQDPVMRRAGVTDPEEFRTIAMYLNERGWIAEADDDYGIFVVTAAGVAEATK